MAATSAATATRLHGSIAPSLRAVHGTASSADRSSSADGSHDSAVIQTVSRAESLVSCKARLGRAAVDDLEADVDHLRGRRLRRRCGPGSARPRAARSPRGRRGRSTAAGKVCWVNSRSPKPIKARSVGTASPRERASSSAPWASRSELQNTAVGRAPRSNSAAEALPSQRQRRRRGHGDHFDLGAALRFELGQEAAPSGERARVVGPDQAEPAMALGEEVARDRFADLLVGEAHQHVDRRGRHVPGLDDRDPGVDETLPGLRRVIDAGEVDRVRTPAQHRGEQRVLARGRIARTGPSSTW